MTTFLNSIPETLAKKVGAAMFNTRKSKNQGVIGALNVAEKKLLDPATIKKIAGSMSLFSRLYSSIVVRPRNGEETGPTAITALSAHEAGCVTGGMPVPDPAQTSNEGDEGDEADEADEGNENDEGDEATRDEGDEGNEGNEDDEGNGPTEDEGNEGNEGNEGDEGDEPGQDEGDEGNEGVARRGSDGDDDGLLGGFACGADGGSDEDACGADACAVDAGGATDGTDADPFGAGLAAGIDIDWGV